MHTRKHPQRRDNQFSSRLSPVSSRSSRDTLTVPKVQQQAAASPAAHRAPDIGSKGYAHTLNLRLTAERYRRLRPYVAAEKERAGSRLTHQGVIETALSEYLDKEGG